MRTRVTISVASVALVLVGAGALLIGNGAGQAQAETTEPQSAVQKAMLLTTAVAINPATSGSAYVGGAENARAHAAKMGARIPLPSTGTFDDLQWRVADEQGVSQAEIQVVLEFNALCDWERQVAQRGSATDAELAVLKTVPSWPSFRGRDHATPVIALLAALDEGDLAPLRKHMAANCVF